MPKLAIYVPKKEMREIDKWRKKINFSKIFMQALKQEIRERTRTSESLPQDKLSAAARHYKQKLIEGSASVADFGYELGSQEILDCQLTPEVIHQLVEIGEQTAGDLGDEQQRYIEKSLKNCRAAIEAFCREHSIDEQTNPAWRDALYRGYLKGITVVWEQVCREMKSME